MLCTPEDSESGQSIPSNTAMAICGECHTHVSDSMHLWLLLVIAVIIIIIIIITLTRGEDIAFRSV